MAKNPIQSALKSSVFLKNSKIEEKHFVTKSYKKGELLHDTINGVESIGLLMSGCIDVYSIAADGNEVRLSILHPGECFGIANLFEVYTLETLLKCRANSEILYIPKKILQEEILSNPSLAEDYIRLCNKKIQFLLRRIELLTIQSSRGKLIEYLLTVSDDTGKIEPACSRDDMARLLGISRAALFRELHFLQKNGQIRTDGSTIFILNRDILEQLLL